MSLSEKLELDITAALRGIDRIEAELTATAKRFGVGLAEALSILSRPTEVAVDATPVTTAIDAAVEAADTTIVPDDTSAITTDIDAAVEAADGSVPVESEGTEEITTGIDAAVDAADATVPVEPTGEEGITSSIDEAVQAANSTVVIEGDAAALTAELDDLGGAADDATEGLTGAASATSALQTAGNAAANDLATVASGLSDVAGAAGDVIAVALTVGVAVGGAVSAALEAETAQRRYNASLGDFADRVSGLGIVGFADSLDELAERTGNSGEALKFAAARLFDLGASSEVAGPLVAETTEQVSLLAIRASVLNPTLGDAGALTDTLTGALARGGRTLNDFGLSLNASEIEARALADTGKRTADELTQYDRSAAGAALATERLGDRLRTDIVEAADQPAIALRRLRVEFGNALAVFGQPLLEPVIAAARSAQPVLLGLAEVFADLATTGLPVVIRALDAAQPAIEGVGLVTGSLLNVLDPVISLIDAIPEPVLTVVGSFLALRAVLNPLQTTIPAIGTGIANLLVPNAALGLGATTTAAAFTPWGLAIAGVSTALAVGVSLIGAHSRAQEEQRKQLEAGRKAFLDSTEATEKYIESQIKSRIESKNQTDDLTRAGLSLAQYRELLDSGSVGLEQFLSILARSGEITENDRRLLLGLTGAQANYRASVNANIEGNLGLVKSFQAQQKALQEQAKAALTTLVAEGRLAVGTGQAIEVLNRRADGTVDYVAAVKEANEVVRQQALAEIAAGTATEAARAKNEALKAVYDELALVLKETTEGTTAGETALARYGPALGAAVDQYVRGAPSVEALAAIQAQFGIDTELLSGVIDDHAARLAEARAANEAWVRAGVEGLTSITEAGKILDTDTSFQKYIDRLRKTAQDQVAFSDNVAKLIARGADDIARNLLEQGISAAGFAAELTRTGDKRLAAQETQVERTSALFTLAETRTAANGQNLVNITTATNTAISNAPPPNIAGPITAAFDPAISGMRSRFADVQRIAATGGDDAGGAFALGFASGIAQRAPTATTEAETMARRTVEAAKRLLRAFSPSRVMMDLGGDVAEGMALGIAAGVADVERAADRLALAAVPSLGSATTPAVASVVVADAVARSGSAAASAAAGPAVVVGSGGTFLRIEASFGPGSDQAGVTEALREFARGELRDALNRVGMRVDMQGSRV